MRRRSFIREVCLLSAAPLLWLPAAAANRVVRGNAVRVPTVASSISYLLHQDFGAGFSDGESWSKVQTSGTIDEDYATSPAPLDGAKSCRLNGSDLRLNSPSFTAQNEAYLYFMAYLEAMPGSTATLVTFLGPNIGLDRLSDGTLRMSGSVNSAPTTDATALNTLYHFRLRYLIGGGGDALASVEFNTTPTWSGSGNKFTSFTTGSETQQVSSLRYHAESGTMTYIIDKVRLAATAIPDNPT